MLFRGQNILGYNHYADDVVEYFVQKSIANGIDIIRIFDCLNDMRNLETAVKATKQRKEDHAADRTVLHPWVMLIHWITGRILQKRLRTWEQIPSVSRIWQVFLTPYKATELVTGSEGSATKLPIRPSYPLYLRCCFHDLYEGCRSRLQMSLTVQCAPLALGTSQPATEVMVETFRGTPYDTGYDQKLLAEIADYFRPIREEALKTGLLNPKVLGVNIKTLHVSGTGRYAFQPG